MVGISCGLFQGTVLHHYFLEQTKEMMISNDSQSSKGVHTRSFLNMK